VHEVRHDGEFFRCRGRSFVCRSPQGQPVLWQAGSSDRGRDFAYELVKILLSES